MSVGNFLAPFQFYTLLQASMRALPGLISVFRLVNWDHLVIQMPQVALCSEHTHKKRKEKTTPFGVNLMRSQVVYRAAQVTYSYVQVQIFAKAQLTVTMEQHSWQHFRANKHSTHSTCMSHKTARQCHILTTAHVKQNPRQQLVSADADMQAVKTCGGSTAPHFFRVHQWSVMHAHTYKACMWKSRRTNV